MRWGLDYRPSRFAIIKIFVSLQQLIALLQFALYIGVGGVCFSIDITGFVVLRHCGLAILTASAISFGTSTIINYFLCCTFVFRSGRFSRGKELFRLFAIAIGGLSLNSAAVWLLAEILGFDPISAKVLAVLPVLAWNFLGRRLIVFNSAPPVAIIALAQRVRGSF